MMPRTARIKGENAIYHIMMRSISDVKLFRSDADKEKFFTLLLKYKNSFLFKIYAYCIMDTHVHLLINSNGADISKFMHNINQCYAQYYNNKYSRTGHVFGDRFKSNIATNDVSVMCMSAYIHNNPKDIRGYRNCVENYKYSSLNVYIGKANNSLKLVDTNFILNHFHADPILSKDRYYEFVKSRIDSKFNFLNDETYILDDIKAMNINNCNDIATLNESINRSISYEKIIKYVCSYIHVKESLIFIKYNHAAFNCKAICAFLMRCFSSYSNKEISAALNATSLSSVSRLCDRGYNLIKDTCIYKNIIYDFIKYQTNPSS